MAYFYKEPSYTFSEYLLLPNLTKATDTPENVSLKTPLAAFKNGETARLSLNIPFTSAIMQSVSDDHLSIALAKEGGLSFIFASQTIEEQARMVERVKKFKAGFVVSDATLKPDHSLKDMYDLLEQKGHTTMPVTNDGTAHGLLDGMLTSRDYRQGMDLSTKISTLMTPVDRLVTGHDGISLEAANEIIFQHKLNVLPITDTSGNLVHLVFRKDADSHRNHPCELTDKEKRYVVGAGINTRDYAQRIPALVDAGADVLCMDSSDGFSEYQKKVLDFVKSKYGNKVIIGAGNVVDREGFLYLANAGADFIKVGIGGGSICITREQKGIGRGQATSIIEVAAARDAYFDKTGTYIPICSDGGVTHDYHITLALAMGADFVMMGRYFARFDESPSRKIKVKGGFVKEYWGEGANRAKNWQRYHVGGNARLTFEEGVDGYVPYAGRLNDNLAITLYKIKSTMCNCGAATVAEFQRTARITLVSALSLREGGAHDIQLRDDDFMSSK
ncbi:MAG: IMP dehydrogenase [Deltaproteobacteria bacterium]|nr:IMP dehydrogenase [Deltaproteobacteria bacterium]